MAVGSSSSLWTPRAGQGVPPPEIFRQLDEKQVEQYEKYSKHRKRKKVWVNWTPLQEALMLTCSAFRSSKYELHHRIVRSQPQVMQSCCQSSRYSYPVREGAWCPSVYVIETCPCGVLLFLLNVRVEHVQDLRSWVSSQYTNSRIPAGHEGQEW